MDWRHVTMARRILASERGAIVKDWGGQVPIALAYPNSYSVGMSSLAVHGLYSWFNDLPGVVCERTFASWGRRASLDQPLVTLESQRPVRDAAAVGFSVSFEMDYFSIVSMLRRAHLRLMAEEREEGDPLVIMGGPAVSANPEPLALIADAIVIGEAEPVLADLVECIRGSWSHDRAATLADMSRIPGLYVPLMSDGHAVRRQWLRDLDDYPVASSIIAPNAEFGDMHLIEISRGCGRGCRFCLAGHWYRPPRERSLEFILSQAQEGLKHRKKIGLVASSASDYSRIDELVTELRGVGADISVSSLRVQPLSAVLVRALAESGARSITLAPEAGSERLRQAINKGVTHEGIVSATALAASHGFQTLKLYFMLGLPHESDQDIGDLIHLVDEIRGIFPRRVVVSLTPFVPKAHTPFERAPMAPRAVLEARLARIRQALRQMRVQLRTETVEAARVQGILSRGDRRVGRALIDTEPPNPKGWERVLVTRGLPVEEYLGERAAEERLPWDVVDSRIAGDDLQAYRHQRERGTKSQVRTLDRADVALDAARGRGDDPGSG